MPQIRARLLVGAFALFLLAAAGAPQADARSPNDVRRFFSRPDLRPPRLTVVHPGRSDRHLFLAPSNGPGQHGTLILDGRGDIVWFRPATPLIAMNFRTATYKGERVL